MDCKDLQTGQTTDMFWFKAKNDLIQILMKKACKNKKGLRILNIGVGTGDDLKILHDYGNNYVIDINKKALSVVNDRWCVEKKHADACTVPYPDNFFDVVVSFDVFEHIKNDRKAVREVRRVLKKNGFLIFSVPAFQVLFSSHDKALHHRRRYDKKSIIALLSPFNKIRIFYWNSLLFVPLALMRIIKKESKTKVDQMNLAPWLNSLFYRCVSLDNYLIQRNNSMPFGLSIVGYCCK
ncbi:MAG: class I SAM-dependent methyltransferase [Nanoarchaeota archaeon]